MIKMTTEEEKAARRRAEEAFYIKLGPSPAFSKEAPLPVLHTRASTGAR